jgi:hypothetical protein
VILTCLLSIYIIHGASIDMPPTQRKFAGENQRQESRKQEIMGSLRSLYDDEMVRPGGPGLQVYHNYISAGLGPGLGFY